MSTSRKRKRREGAGHDPKIKPFSNWETDGAARFVGQLFKADYYDLPIDVTFLQPEPEEGDTSTSVLELSNKFRYGRPRICWVRHYSGIAWDGFKGLVGDQQADMFSSKMLKISGSFKRMWTYNIQISAGGGLTVCQISCTKCINEQNKLDVLS